MWCWFHKSHNNLERNTQRGREENHLRHIRERQIGHRSALNEEGRIRWQREKEIMTTRCRFRKSEGGVVMGSTENSKVIPVYVGVRASVGMSVRRLLDHLGVIRQNRIPY